MIRLIQKAHAVPGTPPTTKLIRAPAARHLACRDTPPSDLAAYLDQRP
jgi:hypothetical protein